MATCTVTGTILNASEVAYPNAVVRATPEAADVNLAEIGQGGLGYAVAPVEIRTGALGTFSLTLVRGVRYRLEIPAILYDRVVTIPAIATITFDLLTLLPLIEAAVDRADLDTGTVTVTVTVRCEPIRTLIRLWESVVVEVSETGRGGPWVELDEEPLSDERTSYTVIDAVAAAGNFYRARYRVGATDAPPGDPRETESTASSLLLTPSELRELYLFGIDLTDDDGRPYPDRMFQHYIDAAIDWLHDELDIPIVEERITDETQDHYASDYGRWGYFQLQNYPVTEIEQVAFQYPTMTSPVIINDDWIVLSDGGAHGVVQIVPGQGNIADALLIPGALMPLWSGATGRVPSIWHFTYKAGFRAGSLPGNIKDVLGMRASLGILDIAGDLVAGAGLASFSIGVPGANQSIGTTASATNAGYGARVIQYSSRIKETLPILKRFYGKGSRLYIAG